MFFLTTLYMELVHQGTRTEWVRGALYALTTRWREKMAKMARKTMNRERKERRKNLHKEAPTRVLQSKEAGEFVYKELVGMMKRRSTPTSLHVTGRRAGSARSRR